MTNLLTRILTAVHGFSANQLGLDNNDNLVMRGSKIYYGYNTGADGVVSLPAIGGSPTESATLYVSTDGSDANSGSGWGDAKATLQAAIGALPSNGGIVELGYGTFTASAGYTVIDSNLVNGPVHIRGRGMGRTISGGGSGAGGQTVSVHPTVIASTLIIRASPSLIGGVGVPESLWAAPVLLEDCAVTVPSGQGWNGVGVVNANPLSNFRRVAFDSNASHGVMSGPMPKFTAAPSGTSGTLAAPWAYNTASTYVLIFSDGEIRTGVTLTNNSTAVTWAGALTGTPTVYAMAALQGALDTVSWFTNFEKCLFVGNSGCAFMGGAQVTGFYDCRVENNLGNGSGNINTPFTGQGTNCSALDFSTVVSSQEVSFYNSVIQRQQGGCGAITYNGTALQLSGCHIENNHNTNQGEISVSGGAVSCTGCFFVPGPSTAAYGVWLASNNQTIRVVGCDLQSAANWTQGFTNATAGQVSSGATWGNRYSTAISGAIDGALSNSGNVWGGFLAAPISNPAMGRGVFMGNLIFGDWQQVLSAAGAVTFDASTASGQICVLAANASSSSITNPSHGQLLSITWEQDNTGSRTYAWPANCKFAGNTAPVASTAANTADTVTFRCFYTGTNYYWREISRAVGVPAPAT